MIWENPLLLFLGYIVLASFSVLLYMRFLRRLLMKSILRGATSHSDTVKSERAQEREMLKTVGCYSYDYIDDNHTENQDNFYCSSELGSLNILVIADGASSSRLAKIASQTAVETIRKKLESVYQETKVIDESQIAEGFNQVIKKLREEKLKRETDDNALATTLIVVAESKDKIVYGYVGNGGLFLFRKHSKFENFGIYYPLLSPQQLGNKTALITPKGILPASMPAFIGATKKLDGDVIVAGTDGIFNDDMAKYFVKNRRERLLDFIHRKLIEPGESETTSLNEKLETIVKDLTGIRYPTEQDDPIIHDDATLGALILTSTRIKSSMKIR